MPESPDTSLAAAGPLHHRRAGRAGGPTVVFLHALGSDLALWTEVTDRLAATCDTVACDLRGHGGSPAAGSAATMADLARDVAGLLGTLEIRAATVVGVSIGGLVALGLARDFPGLVEGLVLVDTAARIGTRELWQERIRVVAAGGLAPIADATVARWFTREFAAAHPAVPAQCRQRLVTTPVDGYLAACAALRDADYRGDLPALGCRAVVWHGDQDASVAPDLGRELAAGLRAPFHLLSPAAHLSPREHPGPVAEGIRDFLRAAPGA